MDVLSEVLGAVRLNGAFYFKVDASEPWVSVNPSMHDIGSAVMSSAEHVIPFHIMIKGSGLVRLTDASLPIPIEQGSIVMLPAGDAHILSSHQHFDNQSAIDIEFYIHAAENKIPFRSVEIGGNGDAAQFVCGYLGCDARPFNPLLEALPKLLVINSDSNDFTRELVLTALKESDNPGSGSEAVLAKLSELMFVHALRILPW